MSRLTNFTSSNHIWNSELHIHSTRKTHIVLKPHDMSCDVESHMNKRVCHTESTMKVEVAVF